MSEPESDSVEHATKVLRLRMTRAALAHLNQFDVRSGTALEVAGVLARDSDPEIDTELLRILADPAHPRRVVSRLGPLVFYRSSETPEHLCAFDVRALLLSNETQSRAAALNYFDSLRESDPPIVSPHTILSFAQHRDLLLEPDAAWKEAGLAVYDAVDEDLLTQLSGLRQSLEHSYEDGLKQYLHQLVCPSIDSLNALNLRFLRPSKQSEEILQFESELVVSDTAVATCLDRHIESLGILPLSGPGDFVSFVNRLSRTRNIPHVGHVLCEWSRMRGPLARFYALLWFIRNADELDQELAILFSEVIDGLVDKRETAVEQSEPLSFWNMHEELAAHYLRHFEILAPGAMPEALAIAAWWLAAKFTTVLCSEPHTGSRLWDIAILPEMRNTQIAWTLVHIPGNSDVAGNATHWSTSPWKISLLANLNSKGATALSRSVPEGRMTGLASEIVRIFVFWWPKPAHLSGAYLFDVDLHKATPHWLSAFGHLPQFTHLQSLADFYSEVSDPKQWVEKLRGIARLEDSDQAMVANSAMLHVLQGTLPTDAVWQMLEDASWRDPAFSQMCPMALEILFSALSRSLVAGGEQWVAGLPHLYALSCEATEDTERRDLLFTLTLVSSMHSNSVSAIERLLCGRKRNDYMEHAREWRTRLLDIARSAPRWASARMRAMTAAISASL